MDGITPDLPRVAEIERRANGATPGPWHSLNPDDEVCMNVHTIRTDMDDSDLQAGGDDHLHKGCIAMTLLQSPRHICHESDLWEENANFIAHSRNDVPWLCETVRNLVRACDRLCISIEQCNHRSAFEWACRNEARELLSRLLSQEPSRA